MDLPSSAHNCEQYSVVLEDKLDQRSIEPSFIEPSSQHCFKQFEQKLLAIFLSAVTTFAVSVMYQFQSETFKKQSHLLESQSLPFSLAEYERLRLDMSSTDAQAILGRGIEESRTKTKATLIWENPDGSSIRAIFANDQLISKKQVGLK